MKRFLLIAIGLIAGAFALAQPVLAQRFRSTIDIVSLALTIVDAQGRYITDLEQNDISVFEDGVKQDVTFFTKRPLPIQLSLLLDSSASVEDKSQTRQTAAINFVKRMKPTDLAQVIDFDSRVSIRQTFTSNQEELEAAIKSTVSGGSTSLHHALY